MATYEVTEVGLPPERLQRLRGFEIDSPRAGDRSNLHVLHAIGWAVGTEQRATEIEVCCNGELVRLVPVRGPRADVAASLDVPPETDCVFHALVGLVGLPTDARLDLRVVLADGSRVDGGWITVSRSPLRTTFEPRLRPLIVTSLGRSGSTWLMQMLAAHHQVVVFRRFPYESAPARYWLHALRVLADGSNLVQSTDPNTFAEDPWEIGSNPYHDDRVYEQAPLAAWFAGAHVERLAAFHQQAIEDWYMTLARTQAQEAPVYFAEKHMWPDYLGDLTWELYPRAREVFLVRDFRDMALSILAFDRRRGFPGFGRPDGVSDEEYVRGRMGETVTGLLGAWSRRRERAHLMRYEDLVGDPAAALTGLLAYLELDQSPATVEAALAAGSEEVLRLPGASHEPAEVAAHRTAGDGDSSVGRWRRESDQAFTAATQDAFGEALAAFGYQ